VKRIFHKVLWNLGLQRRLQLKKQRMLHCFVSFYEIAETLEKLVVTI
jgi:hypothetical protein